MALRVPRSLGLLVFSSLAIFWLVWRPVDAARYQAPNPQPEPNQNQSGAVDWDLGQYYRDRDYKVGLPIQNNCNVGQTVTLEYPKTLKLTGPPTIDVGPHTSEIAWMTLELSRPPVKPPPYPPGAVFNCHLVTDQLILTHPELKVATRKGDGTEIYTCHEMTRTYTVKAFVHEHGAPEPPDPGGGGGKKRPKANSTCSIYWNHAEFFPNPAQHEPEQCKPEIQSLATDFFGSELDPIRKITPADFEFLPPQPDIGHLSVKELIELKAKVDNAVKARK